MIRTDSHGSDLVNQDMKSGANQRLTEGPIRNPNNQSHFMHIQTVGALVEIYIADELIARSEQAVWLQETGKTVYPPRVYLPKTDLLKELVLLDKKTHCPLKGDASYYSYFGKEIAWSYDAPLEFAQVIKGLVSFTPERVRMEIGV